MNLIRQEVVQKRSRFIGNYSLDNSMLHLRLVGLSAAQLRFFVGHQSVGEKGFGPAFGQLPGISSGSDFWNVSSLNTLNPLAR
jgi:hypothetical protein